MIRRRVIYLTFHLRVITLLLPMIAFGVAAYIRFFSGILGPPTLDFEPAAYFGLALFTTFIWAVATDHCGLCQIEQLFAAGGKTRKMVLACGVTYATVTIATFFYRGKSFSRLFMGISAVVLLALLLITRVGFRVLLDRERRRHKNCVRVLMVGADDFANRAARHLTDGQVMPCDLAGFVRLPDQAIAFSSSPIFELDDLPRLALNNGIDDVVLAISPARWAEIPKIMSKLDHWCVPIRVVLDLGERVFVRDRLFDFGGVMMLDLQATPAESVMYLVLKRAFDIAFSLSVLILTAPVMAIVAVAIKLTSPGPLLFVQERVGLNGKVFQMYKFRTMRVEHQDESDTRWTIADDPHRTKLGIFLRRTSLDELPQFFNVLKGDMSVVGPRPERPHFVQKFLQEVASYNGRHYLKVGITGWAQVNGWRGDTSIAKRVEHDLYYLRNWSFTFDLQIILLTLLRGVSHKNAY